MFLYSAGFTDTQILNEKGNCHVESHFLNNAQQHNVRPQTSCLLGLSDIFSSSSLIFFSLFSSSSTNKGFDLIFRFYYHETAPRQQTYTHIHATAASICSQGG